MPRPVSVGVRSGYPVRMINRTLSPRTGIKARLGLPKSTSVPRRSIKSRLGAVGSKALGGLVDARDKINSGRITKARLVDARGKIEAGRKKNITNFTSQHSLQGIPRGSTTLQSGEPIRNLIITTPNSPARGNLFQSAVSGMGMSEWNYAPPGPPPRHASSRYSPEPMLTRTISNNSYQLSNQGRQPFTVSSSSASVAKVAPRFGNLRSDYVSSKNDDYMDVDIEPRSARQSMHARLDSPQYKVRVSNLQSSVTVDDVIELFSDVGELINAKSLGSGVAEAYYRSKTECLKAVEAYHNRLLDGRPMKVIFEGPNSDVSTMKAPTTTTLKSASGASPLLKIPKSSAALKIHPDLSAIHKVLFQPTTSSTVAKGLFKGAGQ